MKRFFSTSSLKAVMVGVVISGMATACQNGSNNPIGGFLPSEENSAANTVSTKASGTAAQSDEERKREQARKIAEFLAKPEVKEMSAGLEEIAQAVAVAVEDKALTQRIYEKSMEKFDGATNVLWMHLESDSKLKGNGGWNKRINDVLGKSSKRNVQNVDAAIKKFEKTVGAPLHLYWMNAEAWDKKTTPLVAFVPFDVNPKTRTSIPAFDSKGNRVELGKDGALAKQRPVIVVNVNERTDAQGNVKGNRTTTNQDKDGTRANAADYFDVVLTSVWFHPSLAWDELPWDGPSEFMCFSIQSIETAAGLTWRDAGSPYLGNVTTNVTHTRSDFIASGALGIAGGWYFGYPNVAIHWWEDDFAYGADPFDDDLGWHGVNTPTQQGVSFPSSNNGLVSGTYRVTTF